MTFSVASTVRSATSRRISWIARRVSASMSRRVCSMSSSRLARASSIDSRSWTSPALRGAGDDLVGLRAGVLEPLAVLLEQLLGLLLGPLGGVDRLLDRALALVERLGDPRGRALEHEHRGDEDEQRPDHQPDAGLDEEAAAARSAAASVVTSAVIGA